MLLKKTPVCSSTNIEDKSFRAFQAALDSRKALVEHSILNRINCHKSKYDQLYKSSNKQFNEKNRYDDMLPFEYNRVVLTKPANPVSPIYRSTSVSLKDKGDRRPMLNKDDVVRTTSELNINRIHKSSNNMLKQTN